MMKFIWFVKKELIYFSNQKIEDAVVGGYKKIENTFVDTFLEKDDQAHGDEVSSAGEVDSKSGKSPEDAE